MMGIKERVFIPIADVSIEDLVPKDHFYRHLDAKLDLSFVRDLVADCYSQIGRPSIDLHGSRLASLVRRPGL